MPLRYQVKIVSKVPVACEFLPEIPLFPNSTGLSYSCVAELTSAI